MEKEKKQVTVKLTPFEVSIISGSLLNFRNSLVNTDSYPVQTACVNKLVDMFCHLNEVLHESED